eukprot:4256834-Karenia_brevis.AAC.1
MPPKMRASYAQLLLDIRPHGKDQPLSLACIITPPSSAAGMPQPNQAMSDCLTIPAFEASMTTLVDSSHKLIAEQTGTIAQLTIAVWELKDKCNAMGQTYPK